MKEHGLPQGFERQPRPEDLRPQGDPMGKGPAPTGFMGRPGPGRSMGQKVEYAENVKETLSRLMNYFRKEKKLLATLLLCVVGVTLAGLLAPSIQGKAIDSIKNHTWDTLSYCILALLLVYPVYTLLSLGQALLAAKLSQSITGQLRHDLFQKIDRLSIKYLDTHSNGDIMSRMTNDVENVSSTVSQSLGSLVSGVLTIIGTVSIMFFYCWQLTLITMVSVILTVLVTGKMSKLMRKAYRKRSALLGQLNGHSEEMITGYRSIVAYGKEGDVTEEFRKTSDALRTVSIKAEILGGSMGPIMNCISNISFVIVAAFGGYFAFRGNITIGTVSAFIIYAKQFSRPINEIAQLYGAIQTAIAGAERVFKLLDEPDEDDSGTLEPENITGKISFRNVDFSYVPGKQVLYDFDLDVEPGQKIALRVAVRLRWSICSCASIPWIVERSLWMGSISVISSGTICARILPSFCRTRCSSPIPLRTTSSIPIWRPLRRLWYRRRK